MDRSLLAALASVMLVAACAEQPVQMAGPALPPAPLPTWRVGDTVSWSNGQTETVTAVDGEVVQWKDQDGNSFSGYRNFLLPSLKWDYPKTSAVTTMDVQPDTMWPLETGNSAHFMVNQRLTMKIHNSEMAYHDEWNCLVDGTERVTVKLGSFNTWKLRCQRFWRGSNIGEIVWNYSPELGQVVRRTWTGAEEPEELVAIGSGTIDSKAEKVADKVRQRGLEALASGAKAMGRANDIEAMVQPRATFVTDNGTFCRDFLQTLSTPKARATSVGSACRDTDGKWVVVDRMKEKKD
ncbi:MAG TPA: hypothetical protein VL974_02990 [Magnetospirillum sp.]|jgi:surface antigen|nr:hypothetical protein [Magnetospirillum sp.]